MIAAASVCQFAVHRSDQRGDDSRRRCDWCPGYDCVGQQWASRPGRFLVCEMNFVDDRVICHAIAKAHEALAHPIFVTPARVVVEHTVALTSAKIESNVAAPV